MQATVKKDRDKYVGGSDIPAILGISKFKSRYDLLLEKAGLKEPFEGNQYTEYGNIMEPKIREYVSTYLGREFVEDVRIDGRLRYHADGYDGHTVLEIKTTSRDVKDWNDCKDYMAQLTLGLNMFDAKEGLLAVYKRPDDFSEDFDKNRLMMFYVPRDEKKESDILAAADAFLFDLDYLKENPFTSDEELPSKREIVPIANEIVSLESEIASLKAAEKRLGEKKAELKAAMDKYYVTQIQLNSGTLITRVKDGEDREVEEFDEKAFREKEPELWRRYSVKKTKKGRQGYIRITFRG